MADHPGGGDPESRLGQLTWRLQAALRAAFEKVAAEPLPPSLKEMLGRLRAAEDEAPPEDKRDQ